MEFGKVLIVYLQSKVKTSQFLQQKTDNDKEALVSNQLVVYGVEKCSSRKMLLLSNPMQDSWIYTKNKHPALLEQMVRKAAISG